MGCSELQHYLSSPSYRINLSDQDDAIAILPLDREDCLILAKRLLPQYYFLTSDRR
ncbi:MAG: hypothetical protein HC878_00220 [Leptolyngbyaceae cyanobacterium SL_5_14]|nr:hypothetical protein [Leptolyngbyaceae cyanobacterium SL_5_14]